MFGARGSGDTSGFGGLAVQTAWPGPSPRPFGGWFDQVVDTLSALLQAADAAEAIEQVVVDRGELTIHVGRGHLLTALAGLRDHPELRFELSLGVSGAHYPDQTGRELHAVYHLVSITHGTRQLRVEAAAPEADPAIPSSVGVYPAHNWHEREVYDMFGIVFPGHPALARILLPDDWTGHPQRKDHPLGGIGVQFDGATVPPADLRRRYY
ncbi:MAG: NADH-quinone oxidoreductase subunit C [Bifidobacteriaceae bacterium]|nr:NADH-quinone oxidoreductase subunit C [Bifidobacteriaceae bacterium]